MAEPLAEEVEERLVAGVLGLLEVVEEVEAEVEEVAECQNQPDRCAQ